MDISSITDSSTTSSSSSGVTTLSSDEFYELLITEMQNQDPFQPSDTSDMINQVSQIQSIQANGQLSDTLRQLVDQQTNLGAADLIGKYVEATTTDDDGNETLTSGIVTGVHFGSDGSVALELDTGMTVSAENVDFVSTLEQLETMYGTDGTDETNSTSTTDKSSTTAKPSWLTLDGSLQL
ncbi:MAG: hypothetical protein JXO22_04340 [Phycisphaerae bacterium]|nr:hypothetical protein [Phycisphaerae bacterium]